MPSQEILEVKSLDKFKELIAHETRLSVVHFWASWANQCVQMDEAMKVLSEEIQTNHASFIRVSTN